MLPKSEVEIEIHPLGGRFVVIFRFYDHKWSQYKALWRPLAMPGRENFPLIVGKFPLIVEK